MLCWYGDSISTPHKTPHLPLFIVDVGFQATIELVVIVQVLRPNVRHLFAPLTWLTSLGGLAQAALRVNRLGAGRLAYNKRLVHMSLICSDRLAGWLVFRLTGQLGTLYKASVGTRSGTAI